MIEFISEYWALAMVVSFVITSNTLNLTVFKDVKVSPEKDHIESGWQKGLDEAFNIKQENRRKISTKLMWVFIFIVAILSFVLKVLE